LIATFSGVLWVRYYGPRSTEAAIRGACVVRDVAGSGCGR